MSLSPSSHLPRMRATVAELDRAGRALRRARRLARAVDKVAGWVVERIERVRLWGRRWFGAPELLAGVIKGYAQAHRAELLALPGSRDATVIRPWGSIGWRRTVPNRDGVVGETVIVQTEPCSDRSEDTGRDPPAGGGRALRSQRQPATA